VACLGLPATAAARLRALLAGDARRVGPAAAGGNHLSAAYRGVDPAAVLVAGGASSAAGRSAPPALDAAAAAALAVAAARSACGRAGVGPEATEGLLGAVGGPGGVGEAYEAELTKALSTRVGAGGGDWERCPRAVERFGPGGGGG